MKKCICCLYILIWGLLVACSDPKEPKYLNPLERGEMDTTIRLIHKEVYSKVRLDSIFAKKAAVQAAHLDTAIRITEALNKAYDETTEETENYVEFIPFTTFLGKPVESGALEVIQFQEQQYTRIYADYLDGEPLGGRLFFIENKALVAIEIIELKEKVTENGAIIEDESTYMLYYHDEVLLSMIDLSTNNSVETTEIPWLDENLADWELVKAHLNTLGMVNK